MAPSELTWDQKKYGLLTLFYKTRKFRDKYLEKGTVEECIFFKVIGYHVNTPFIEFYLKPLWYLSNWKNAG